MGNSILLTYIGVGMFIAHLILLLASDLTNYNIKRFVDLLKLFNEASIFVFITILLLLLRAYEMRYAEPANCPELEKIENVYIIKQKQNDTTRTNSQN